MARRFRIIIALLFDIGKRRTLEPMSPRQPCPEPSFDVAAIARFSWRAVVDGNIVILARAPDHCASELLCIVAVDYAHFSPARPLSLHTHGREPILLWQYSMRNCEAGCEGAWLLEIDGEAEHHATAHIDNDGQRRALDRPPMLLIDHNYVHGRMVDLGDS